MTVSKQRSTRPAESDAAVDSPEYRISIATARRLLVGIALGGIAVFWLILLTGHADPGLFGLLGHLAAALGIAFGLVILALMFVAIGAQKAAEPWWLIGVALGGFAFFWLVLLVVHADPGGSGPFAHKGLAFGFAYGFVFAEVFALVISTLAATGAPGRKGLGTFGPVLKELEKARMLAQQRAVGARLALSPIGAGVGFALAHFLAAPTDYDPGPFEILAAMLGGGLGYSLGAFSEADAYARLYKARVLPTLVGVANGLRYQSPQKAQLQPLQALFGFDALKGDDALVGAYRGLPVVVAQVRALRGRMAVFDGLVVEVTLMNRLAGDTTVVPAPSKGQPHWARPHGLAPVGLEDPVFERAYDVYASDQVMARALLTPAFMERFHSLATRGRFGPPLCLGHASQLFVALPTSKPVFTPPDFDDSASGLEEITQLKADFAAILGVIDTVIDLDSQTRAAALLATPPAPEPRVIRRRRRPSAGKGAPWPS